MRYNKTVLLAACLVASLMLLAGCSKKTPPTVMIGTVSPDTVLFVGDSARLNAEITNPDNVTFTLNWMATRGTFNDTTAERVWWHAPADSGVAKVSVVVTGSDDNMKDTASKNMHVRQWVYGETEFDNIETVPIPTPGTAISADTFPDPNGNPIPSGAIVDSVIAYNIDITFGGGSPDSTPAMNVWIQGPDSTQVQIWNDQQGPFPPNGVWFGPWGAFQGKPVAGVWKLIVTATEAVPNTGAIEDFWLVIYYRAPAP